MAMANAKPKDGATVQTQRNVKTAMQSSSCPMVMTEGRGYADVDEYHRLTLTFRQIFHKYHLRIVIFTVRCDSF